MRTAIFLGLTAIASTILKIKTLKDNSYFNDLLRYTKIVGETINQFETAVKKAALIE